MAGGVGRRLWPLSHPARTKPFITPPGTGTSLLTQAAARCAFFERDLTFVSVNNGLEHLVTQHVVGLTETNVIVEPENRNTLPSLIFSLAHIARRFPDATVLIVASDSVVDDNELFADAAYRAMNVAEAGPYLASIGLRPIAPSTRFGYMALGKSFPGIPDTWFSAGYIEKPALELANQFVADGRHDWNTGAFAWTIETFANALKSCVPEMARRFSMLRSSQDRSARVALFNALTDIDIDRGLLEHVAVKCECIQNVYVRGSYNWDDVGNFEAYTQFLPRDKLGNRVDGLVELKDTCESIIINESKTQLTAVGFHDQLLIVSEQGDLLVAPRSIEVEVGQFRERLAANSFPFEIRIRSLIENYTNDFNSEELAILRAGGVCIEVQDERIVLMQTARKFVVRSDSEFARVGSDLVVETLSRALTKTSGDIYVTMSAGNTPIDIYTQLRHIHRNSIAWKRVHLVQMDEWLGLGQDDTRSFAYQLKKQLIQPLGMQATLLDGLRDEETILRLEDELLSQGGFAFALHGIGLNGHIGFIEPSSNRHFKERAHVAELTDTTRLAAIAHFGGPAPKRGMTLGLRSIAKASKTLLVARGAHKAEAVARALGESSTSCPASLLQRTGALDLLFDLESSKNL